MDRITRLLAGATRSTRILEIGPSHAPIAPRAAGWNTRIVDHAGAEALREKYRALGVDPAAIEEVDFIATGDPLDSVIPSAHHGGFDLVIASHVIEHIPDFAGFFKSLESILAPAGTISLAVPDKRYCFDALKPVTNTGDILAAAATPIHGLRTVWSQRAYSVFYDGQGAWGQHPVSAATFTNTFDEARAVWEAWRPDAAYEDFHAWHFMPAAFALVILELGLLGLIDWHIAGITPAEGCEFFVQLRRGAMILDPVDIQPRRMDLLLQIQREIAEGIAWTQPETPLPLLQPLPEGTTATDAAALAQQYAALNARLAAMQAALDLQNARMLLLVQTPAWARGFAAILRRMRDMLQLWRSKLSHPPA